MLVVLWAWLLHIFVMHLMYSRFLCETCLLCATYGTCTGHRFTVTNRYGCGTLLCARRGEREQTQGSSLSTKPRRVRFRVRRPRRRRAPRMAPSVAPAEAEARVPGADATGGERPEFADAHAILEVLLTHAPRMLSLLRDEDGIPLRRIGRGDLEMALQRLDLPDTFTRAAGDFIQKRFRNSDLTHRQLASFLRFGIAPGHTLPPKAKQLAEVRRVRTFESVAAAYEHGTRSRTRAPVSSLSAARMAARRSANTSSEPTHSALTSSIWLHRARSTCRQ